MSDKHRPSGPAASQRREQRYSARDRLKKRNEYRQVQLTGRRIHTPNFLIVVKPNTSDTTRLGITVTTKVGNAVQRNRIKRVVRDVFRRNRQLFPASHDVVFIAKRGIGELSYASVLTEVERCAEKLHKARRPR